MKSTKKLTMVKIIFLTAFSLLLLPASIVFAGKQTEDKTGEAFQTLMYTSGGNIYANTFGGISEENASVPDGTEFCNFNMTVFVVETDGDYTVQVLFSDEAMLSDDVVCTILLPDMLGRGSANIVFARIRVDGGLAYALPITFLNNDNNIDYKFIPDSANVELETEPYEAVPLDVADIFGSEGAKIKSGTRSLSFSFRIVSADSSSDTANSGMNKMPQTDIAKPSKMQQEEPAGENEPASAAEKTGAENGPVLSSSAGAKSNIANIEENT